MAFASGSDAVLKVDDAAAVLTDISAYLNKVGYPREASTSETTTLGKDSRVRIPGLKDASISFDGLFDPTFDAFLDGILNVLRDYEWFPQGVGTGLPKYAGQVILVSYEDDAEAGEAATCSGEFVHSGDAVRTVQP